MSKSSRSPTRSRRRSAWIPPARRSSHGRLVPFASVEALSAAIQQAGDAAWGLSGRYALAAPRCWQSWPWSTGAYAGVERSSQQGSTSSSTTRRSCRSENFRRKSAAASDAGAGRRPSEREARGCRTASQSMAHGRVIAIYEEREPTWLPTLPPSQVAKRRRFS